jgi:competence protein ComEA
MKNKLLILIFIIIIILVVGFINFNKSIDLKSNSNVQVDILTASVSELTKIPGIGYSKAQSIVNYRSNYGFYELKDIMKVSGIGEKTFENIKKYIFISESTIIFENYKININTAELNEIIKLPGIGSVYAQRIIEYRKVKKITDIEELQKIDIPFSTLEKIRRHIIY